MELTFTEGEIIRLANILKTKEAVLANRVDHYRGLHEIGETTEKQQQLMFDAEEDLNLVRYIIGIAASMAPEKS